VRRVLPPVIGSQLISVYISATGRSLVPHNASPVFPQVKYGVAHATKVCSGVLVRRVLPPVIGSQLISDYISATRLPLFDQARLQLVDVTWLRYTTLLQLPQIW